MVGLTNLYSSLLRVRWTPTSKTCSPVEISLQSSFRNICFLSEKKKKISRKNSTWLLNLTLQRARIIPGGSFDRSLVEFRIPVTLSGTGTRRAKTRNLNFWNENQRISVRKPTADEPMFSFFSSFLSRSPKSNLERIKITSFQGSTLPTYRAPSFSEPRWPTPRQRRTLAAAAAAISWHGGVVVVVVVGDGCRGHTHTHTYGT